MKAKPCFFLAQVLFSEQLKLRNAITGITHVRADNAPDSPLDRAEALHSSQQASVSVNRIQPPQETASTQMDIRALQQDVMFMKARFAELQKDYSTITHQVLPLDNLFLHLLLLLLLLRQMKTNASHKYEGRLQCALVLRFVGVIWLLFLIGHPYLIHVWWGEDQRTNTIEIHVSERLDYVFKLIGYIVNREHNWEGLCIHLRNQQTCVSDDHN